MEPATYWVQRASASKASPVSLSETSTRALSGQTPDAVPMVPAHRNPNALSQRDEVVLLDRVCHTAIVTDSRRDESRQQPPRIHSHRMCHDVSPVLPQNRQGGDALGPSAVMHGRATAGEPEDFLSDGPSCAVVMKWRRELRRAV
jgi:hypothetical protein